MGLAPWSRIILLSGCELNMNLVSLYLLYSLFMRQVTASNITPSNLDSAAITLERLSDEPILPQGHTYWHKTIVSSLCIISLLGQYRLSHYY
jgi:hypothetical protein